MHTKERASGPGGNTEAMASYTDIITDTTSCFHPIRHEIEVVLGNIIRNGGLCWQDISKLSAKHFPTAGPREMRDAIGDLAQAGTPVNEVTVFKRLSDRGELREPGTEVARVMGCESEHGDPRQELARFREYVAADAKWRRALELSWRTFTGSERRKRVQSVFGRLLARGEHPHLAAELTSCWNDKHCAPPLELHELENALAAIAIKERTRRAEAAA